MDVDILVANNIHHGSYANPSSLIRDTTLHGQHLAMKPG